MNVETAVKNIIDSVETLQKTIEEQESTITDLKNSKSVLSLLPYTFSSPYKSGAPRNGTPRVKPIRQLAVPVMTISSVTFGIVTKPVSELYAPVTVVPPIVAETELIV